MANTVVQIISFWTKEWIISMNFKSVYALHIELSFMCMRYDCKSFPVILPCAAPGISLWHMWK